MPENKTKPTTVKVADFLNRIPDARKRAEAFELLELMKKATKFEPVMWGPSIIGFGSYHYRYASGREGDAPLAGFSPRKQNLVVYITSGFERFNSLMKQLGPHSTGVSCLYLKKWAEIDKKVLSELVAESIQHVESDSC